MKILFLSRASSIHTVRWVNSLSEKGHEVHLVYKGDDGPADNKIFKDVKQYCLKCSGTLGYYLNAKQLNKLYRKLKPDVVNAHYASGYGTLARVSKVKPLVLSVWGSDVYDFPYKSSINMKILLKNLKYADQIASTSINMANQVKRLLKDNDKEISVTPFGVDVSLFLKRDKDTSSENLNKKDNDANTDDYITISTIKALSPQYGIDDFINSIKILKGNLINKGYEDLSNKIVAKIYGDGEQRDELQKLINVLSLQESVTLEGRIPNNKVPSALSKTDIFCATSVVNESFGVSIVEAMAMEIPVVATDVPGFKEVVDNGKTGIITRRNNPDDIAKALEKLVLDTDLRKQYGKNGRSKVERLYNWDDNVKKMIEIYKNVQKQ